MGIHILFKAGELLLRGAAADQHQAGVLLPLRRTGTPGRPGRLLRLRRTGAAGLLALGLGFFGRARIAPAAVLGTGRLRLFCCRLAGCRSLPLALLCGLLCLGLRLLLALGCLLYTSDAADE